MFVSRIKRRFDRFHRRWIEKRVSGLKLGKRVRIFDIVCPLRYDIIVRRDFIELIAENKKFLESDSDEIFTKSATKAYEVWFKEFSITQFQPEIYYDEKRLRQYFSVKIEKTKRLWESISSDGFNASHPITLHSGKSILQVNGKKVNASLFAGDGCHRIACLMVMGKKCLEPEQYQVRMHTKFRPLDNTAILIEKVPITLSNYLNFISQGYCSGRRLETENEALAYVEEHNFSRLAELKSVLLQDRMKFGCLST